MIGYERYFLSMVKQVPQKEKKYDLLLRVKKILSPSLHMELLVLVLIFVIFITSCSRVLVNPELECYKVLEEGCVLVIIKIPF